MDYILAIIGAAAFIGVMIYWLKNGHMPGQSRDEQYLRSIGKRK